MKKYIFGVVLSVGLLVSPAFTQAAGLTSSQIQAILSLLYSFGADSSTVTNVSTALGGVAVASTGSTFCYTFSDDITTGSNGNDVLSLNQALLRSGISTSNNASQYTFNEDTAGDVVSFQAKYGIRQTGYVGPMTRAKLNTLYGCHNGQQSTQSTWSTTPPAPAAPAPTHTSPATTPQPATVSAAPQVPQITTISYSAGSNGVAETFTINGNNFSASNSLAYVDTLSQGGNGTLTSVVSISPTQIVFSGDRYTGNMASVYRVRVVDAQGNKSNEITVETRVATPTVFLTTSTSAPGFGQNVTLSWTSNAYSCTLSSSPYDSSWADRAFASGSKVVGPINQTTTYNVTCSTANGISNNQSLVISPRG